VWCLWVQRNDRVFSRRGILVVALIPEFWKHCDQWGRAGLVERPMLLGE
jgi:hypothetical protein